MVFIGVVCCSFLFNFVTDMKMEVAVSPCENSGTDIFSNRNLPELERAVDAVLLSEKPSSLELFH